MDFPVGTRLRHATVTLHPRRVPWLPMSDIGDAVNHDVGRLLSSSHSLTLTLQRTTSALNANCCVALTMQVLLQTRLVTGVHGGGYGDGISTITIAAIDPIFCLEFMTWVRLQANQVCDTSRVVLRCVRRDTRQVS